MICGHPQCTGNHDHVGSMITELCPVAQEKKRARDRKANAVYRQTEKGKQANLRFQKKFSLTAKGMLARARDNARKRQAL